MSGGEKKTHNAARQSTSHEGKANEEEETCAPDGARVTEPIISSDAVLIDQVDDENTKERTDPRDPVCEGDVHGNGVVWLIVWWVRVRREDGGIEKRPKAERKLGRERGDRCVR